MEIIPGIGLDTLPFGMTKSEVFARLGFPNKSFLMESDSRAVQYFALRLELKFESGNDARLGWMEVHNRDSTMLGISPWRMPRSELVALLTGTFGEEPRLNDYGSFESVTFRDYWVELQYELGELSSINFGVRYDDNGEPIWPVEA
ncbi:MAG TPA: hypothetical protein VJ724_02945 [Tahibacter sp.]|nr:hypothetical protein [Tahibacter sp.]